MTASLAAKNCRIHDDVGLPFTTEDFLDTALNRTLAETFVLFPIFRMVRETKVDVADGVELKRLLRRDHRRLQDNGDLLLQFCLIAATRLFFDIAISGVVVAVVGLIVGAAMSSVVAVAVALIVGLLVLRCRRLAVSPFADLFPFPFEFLHLFTKPFSSFFLF